MDVKSTYGYPDGGDLPRGWKSKRLGEIVSTVPSGMYGNEKASDGLVAMPVATTAHISESDAWNGKEMQRRFFTPTQIATYSVKKGDLVVVKSSGSAASIKSGKIALVEDEQAGRFVFSNFLMTLRPMRVNSRYLYFYLTSHNVKTLLPSLVEASTYPNLRVREYLAIEIPMPGEQEQVAIADTLSDAEAFTLSLEQLLTKKRQLKIGAMQELLTGKTRLPGFSDAWEVKRLGDCFSLVSTRNTELNNNVVTISAQQGFVRQEDFFKKRVASSVLENYYLIDKGHFAYNRSYSNGYPFGAIKRLAHYAKAVVTTLYICFCLRDDARSDPTFFEHYFEAGLLNRGLSVVTNEGGRAHGLLNITKADFLSREIRRPPLREQVAIAAILSDMDAELAAVEARLAKAHQLKEGMTQKLLNGTVRLV